jgi:phosphoribosyl-ATP pyrophosphohydrolase
LFERHIQETMDQAQHILEEIRERGCIAPDMTPKIIRMALEHNIHDHAQHMLFVANVGWPEEIVRKQMELSRAVKKIMEEAFEASPDVRVKGPKTAAHIIWSSVRLIIHDYFLYWADDIAYEELITELADMLNRYIFSDNGQSPSL